MNNKFYKLFILILLLSVSFICFAPSITFVKADDEALINYSKNSTTTSDYSYSEIIKLISNVTISESENEYLNNLYQPLKALKIEAKIPVSLVSTSINVSNNATNLSVHASPYSYTDINNNVHIWIPKEATINSITLPLNYINNSYDCIFSDVNDNDSIVSVKYECKFILSKQDCNELLNRAYNDAKAFIEDGIEEIENSKYQEKLALYNEYLQKLNKYNEDLELYRQYIINKNKYDNDYALYQEYLNELAEYNQNEIDYNNYLEALEQYEIDLEKYHTYLNELDNYNILKAEYDEKYPAYYEKITLVRHQLEVVDAIQMPMTSLERSVYNAVMGSAVTSVLERKDELVVLNADEATINRAGAATQALRDLFNQYFSLENENEKYAFYAHRNGFNFVNYQALKYNIEELCRCLDKLYRSGLVANAIDVMKKKPQYLILIAQLALIANGLDDNPVYNYEGWNYSSNKPRGDATSAQIIDENYLIDGKTYIEILENNSYIEDTTINAYPLLDGYPVLIEPVAPTVVENPVRPATVVRMSAPDVVANPGDAPTVVNEPIEVSEVLEPIPFSISDAFRGVVNEYKSFNLQFRQELENDYELNLESNLDKNFRNQTEVTIDFYDELGNFLCSETTDYGSYIVYNLNQPYKEPDEAHSKYKFLYFEYNDSNKILDLNNVTESGWVHPVFEGTLREFNITWIIEGKEYQEIYKYGEEPIYKGDIFKEANNNNYYTFLNWDKEIYNVNKDEVYTALFEEHNIYSDVEEFKINNNVVSIDLGNNDDLFNDGLNIKQLLDIHPNINNLIITNKIDDLDSDKNIKINIDNNNLKKIKDDGITSIKFKVVNNNDGDYTYEISLFKDETEVKNGCMFNVTIDGDFDEAHSSLYYEYGGNNYKVQASFKNKKLSFNMNANYIYHIYPTYEVKILKNDYASISCDKYLADSGDVITVYVEGIKKGIKYLGVYILDEESNKIESYIENGFIRFEMPKSNCYIGMDYNFIYYTVRFIVEENVYSEMTYKIGDEITLPSNPKKISDEKYSYEFTGWTPEIKMIVDGDANYYAQFKEIDTTLTPIESKPSIIIAIMIASLCTLVLSGGAVVTIIILKKKNIIKPKQKAKAKSQSKMPKQKAKAKS